MTLLFTNMILLLWIKWLQHCFLQTLNLYIKELNENFRQKNMTQEKYPVLPLRDIVVYPKMIVPLFVGRQKSIAALQNAIDHDNNIILATQLIPSTEDPTAKDIFHVGVLGTILQLLKLPDGTVKVLIEGLERVKIDKFLKNDEFLEVNATIMPEVEESKQDVMLEGSA